MQKVVTILRFARSDQSNHTNTDYDAYKSYHSFRKYTLQFLGPLNFADVSIFCKKLAFFVQKSTFTQSNSVRAVLEIFQLFSVFVRKKVTFNENIIFADSVPGNGPKLLQNGQKSGKMKMTSQFSDMTSSSNFFDVVLFLLSSFVTGLSFM